MNLKTFAVAALVLVAACAPGNVRLTQLDITPTYSPNEFAYAAAGRDLQVVIVGNPFDGDQAAFEAAVTDAMQGRHWGQPTNFTTMPGAEARLTFRVVLIFNPRVGMNAARQCREEALAVQTVPTDDQIELSAAFCREDGVRTRIRGRVSRATGPEDVAFRELVGQVTNGLFPPARGRNRGRRCPPGVIC
jgi:hypothetical protein